MRFLVLAVAFLVSSVLAHNVAVDISVEIRGNVLEATLRGPVNEPITQAIIGYTLTSSDLITTVSAQLQEVAGKGSYQATLPALPSGQYQLRLIDTTFPGETLQVQSKVSLPLKKAVLLRIPASSANSPDVMLLIILAVAPVTVALLIVVLVLLYHPKARRLREQSDSKDSTKA
jgi:hypothetical protein